MPSETWPDARLDELARKVGRMDEVVTDVAVLKTELRNVIRELRANTSATQEVADQMEKAQLEPINRWRQLRQGLIIAACSALFAGGLGVLGALIASTH